MGRKGSNRGGGRGAGRGGGKGQGRGTGRMGGSQAAGPDGFCICPECNHKVTHQAGKPCYDQKCPECGSAMLRE